MTAEPRWLNDDEQAFWRLLIDTARKMNRYVEDGLMASANLSTSEYAVLVTLSEAEDRQLRLRDLCTDLDWDRSRASHQITRMERRHLVTKEKSPSDGRGVVVGLTDEGMDALLQAVPDHVESVRRLVFDHLNHDDVPALRRFFQGMIGCEPMPTASATGHRTSAP